MVANKLSKNNKIDKKIKAIENSPKQMCATRFKCVSKVCSVQLVISRSPPPHCSGPDPSGSAACPAQRTGASPESGVVPPEPHSPPADSA